MRVYDGLLMLRRVCISGFLAFYWLAEFGRFLQVSANRPRLLLRPNSVNYCQKCWNLSHETFPLTGGKNPGDGGSLCRLHGASRTILTKKLLATVCRTDLDLKSKNTSDGYVPLSCKKPNHGEDLHELTFQGNGPCHFDAQTMKDFQEDTGVTVRHFYNNTYTILSSMGNEKGGVGRQMFEDVFDRCNRWPFAF